jgi:cation diffusion facilitator family transporter
VPPLAHPPANARKTFGYHSVGILAAQSNAITLILVAAWVLFEAFHRFQHPEPVIVFVSAGIGIAIYLIFGFGLSKEGDNVNTKAGALHVFGDVGASLGVIVAGILISLTGWYRLDPLLSECAPILSSLETILHEKYHVGHTTFQFEYRSNQGTCRETDGLYCQMASHHDHDPAEAVVPHVKKEECV